MSRSSTSRRRPAVLVAAALGAVALAWPAVCAPAAWAHADLVTSVPAANAAVAQSPSQVDMTFSEAVDPTLSLVEIVDRTGAPAPGVSPVEAIPGQPLQLRVTLARTLPRGTYSVNWRAVSADDGHVTGGVFVFGVGVTPPPGSAVTVILLHTSGLLSAASAAGRWLLYWGLALLVGAAATGLVALGGKLPPGGVVLLRVAALLGVVGLCVMTVTERVMVGAPSLLPLFETPEGVALLDLGGALILCIVAGALFDLYPGRWTLAAVGVAGAVAMLVHAWAGHADAVPSLRALNLAAQWVHMIAVGAWIGGLAWLLLALRREAALDRAAAVRAFSGMAGIALAVVVSTGLLRAANELATVGDIVRTSYGRALLIKVVLVLVIVSLGALSRYRLVPAVARDEDGVRRFRWVVGSEIAVATAILATTAVLAGLAPALFGG